jgi:hypothetical protein
MSEELTPKLGPNLSDSPESPPEEAKVFGYNVAQQARTGNHVSKPNPNSPLAAG